MQGKAGLPRDSGRLDQATSDLALRVSTTLPSAKPQATSKLDKAQAIG